MPYAFWYMDYTSCNFDGNCYVKEIAILKNDRTQCFNYHITQRYSNYPTTIKLHEQIHNIGLGWDFGEYNFEDAINDIKQKVNNEMVIVADDIKRDFLEKHIPQVLTQPVHAPSESTNCMSEQCELKHGTCARRKVHEMRFSDYNNDINEQI